MLKCNIKQGDYVQYIPTEDRPRGYPKRLPHGCSARVNEVYWEGVIGLKKFIVLSGPDSIFPAERLRRTG